MHAIIWLIIGYFVWILIKRRKAIKDFVIMSARAYPALKDIPGPDSYPVVGCALQFKLDSVEFTFQLEDFARKFVVEHPKRNGMVKAWIGPVPLVFIMLPDLVKVILESNTLITKPVQYDIISEWIGTGLLTRQESEKLGTNEKWQSRRKLLTPTFHFNILKGYIAVFDRQGQIFVDQLEKHADTGREVDLFPFIKRCALDVICALIILYFAETAMGTEMHTQTGGSADYVEAVVRISDIIWSYQRFPWLWLKPVWYGCGMGFEFDRLVKMTNDFTRKVINDRRTVMTEEGLLREEMQQSLEGEVPHKKMAFLDMLLMLQKQNALSDEDIREEVDTFMFEGHDTTSSAMGFTIWFLGQHPLYQGLVHSELDEVFGDSQREPTEGDLKRLVYLERCIKEGLRLTPSVPLIARVLSHDVQLGGITLPKDMAVVFSPIITQRDPNNFERASEFYPDHFLPEKVAKRHPYAYFPFSAGPRNCIGQKFALAEEKTILSWMFRRYRVETVEPFPGNRPVPEIILKPSIGFPVRIYRRR